MMFLGAVYKFIFMCIKSFIFLLDTSKNKFGSLDFLYYLCIKETTNKNKTIMTTTEKENIIKILNDEKILDKFSYLYHRWQDEKEYEDFSDYVDCMMKVMPNSAILVGGSEEPFGVTFKYGGRKVQIAIEFEDDERYCKLVAKIYK